MMRESQPAARPRKEHFKQETAGTKAPREEQSGWITVLTLGGI